ncbi:MAG: hypothetical protein AAF566_08905 [Pseudomonadota bacterium]
MDSTFITTTSTEGLTPLGTAPQRSFELLASSLSKAQAALFAEPIASDWGDKIDWYASGGGRVVPLSELTEEQQTEVRSRLSTLVTEIRDLAAGHLEETENTDRRRLGEALKNALEIPGDGSIFAQEREAGVYDPILVHWAWIEDRQSAVRGVLSGGDIRAPKTPVVGPGAAEIAVEGAAVAARPLAAGHDRRSGRVLVSPLLLWWLYWIGWLILALMILAILILLIAPCALRLPGVPSFCLAEGPSTSNASRLTLVLRDRVGILERQIEIADRACQPEPGIPEFLPPPVQSRPVLPELAPVPQQALPQKSQDIEERLNRANAQSGDLTFSLVWDGPDDLDLEVTCPEDVRLFWGQRSGCNGQVDTDSGLGGPALAPVENIYFNDPVSGEYRVRVTMPTSRSNGATRPFQLLIQDRGQTQVLEGALSGRERRWTHNYTFGTN